jgi:hypothetical protein
MTVEPAFRRILLGNPVDLAQRVHIHIKPRSQRLHTFPAIHGHRRPARQPATIGIEAVLEALGVLERQQDLRIGRAQDHRAVERRIERLNSSSGILASLAASATSISREVVTVTKYG